MHGARSAAREAEAARWATVRAWGVGHGARSAAREAEAARWATVRAWGVGRGAWGVGGERLRTDDGPALAQLHQTRNVVGSAPRAANSAASSGAAASMRWPATSGAER
ncbi:hypothetical protein GCM10023324_60320 [Streptomyces youssoufiensis]